MNGAYVITGLTRGKNTAKKNFNFTMLCGYRKNV